VELRVNSILELGKILINEKQFVRAKNILLPASELQNRSISSRAKFLLIRILEEEGSGRIGIRYLNLAYEFADDKSIVCKSLLKASAIYKSRKEFSTAQKILEKIERSANLEKCNKIAIKKNKLLSNKIRIH
jgi:tetratricopeptide (TPR) repeat protein